MGKVVFRNNEYDVSDGLLDAYEKFVGEVTEEALENLWRYHSVYRVKEIQSELPSLMGTAVYNSVLLWENGFGSIVEYNPNGEICNVFRSVDEMISATNNPSSIYGFEFFDGLKEGLTRK